jgi:nucleoside-diphosphate-sugar epimerase
MRVAVVGASGLVGSEIVNALRHRGDVTVITVDRANYQRHSTGRYDVVVNAAMPSRRFWARTHPKDDYRETVTKTAELVYGWNWGLFVQVSTLSARLAPDTVYGRHKAAAEAICPPDTSHVVRLGPLYGPRLDKGVLVDMATHRTVFVGADSRYAFTPVSWVAERIADILASGPGTSEIGARGSVALGALAERAGSRSEFTGPTDHQEFSGESGEGTPDAGLVLDFLRGRMT